MAVVIFVWMGHAHAQSFDKKALAEQLFNQARDLTRANRWAEACSKLEASLGYEPQPGTRISLAACYVQIGKLASAWGLYREAVELARKANELARMEHAARSAAALEPRLAKLVIRAPATPPPGFVVTRDDTKIDASSFGTALYVDAGEHKISASAPSLEPFTKIIKVIDGNTETIVLPELKATPLISSGAAGTVNNIVISLDQKTSVVASASSNADSGDAATLSPMRRYTAISTAAAGIAAVGVGLIFGARARASYADAKKLCGPDLVCDSMDYSEGKQLISGTRSSATISTVFMATGTAAVITGAVVYLTAPRTPERTATRIVPVTHDRGVGFTVTGGF